MSRRSTANLANMFISTVGRKLELPLAQRINNNNNIIMKNTMQNNSSRRTIVSKSNTLSAMSASNSNMNSSYVSPYAEYFSAIQKNETAFAPKSNSNVLSDDTHIHQAPTLKCGIPEHKLKFKTTSYGRLMLPPYVQHSEYKVTLQVHLNDLPLHTDLEQKILAQVVGTRFDKEKKHLKLTSNHFASRIENKRHLCSMLDRIVVGVQRLAKEYQDSQ